MSTVHDIVEAVYLGIDCSKKLSGAVILAPDYGVDGDEPFIGKFALHDAGEVRTQEERIQYVETLLGLAEDYELVPVVVFETWDPPRIRKVRGPDGEWEIAFDKKWTFDTILGMGEGYGLWMAEVLTADIPVIHRVTPNHWRNELFGSRREKSSEANKALAQRAFEGLFGFRASADISEGGMLALFGATKCPEIAEGVKAELRRRAQKRKPRKTPKVTKSPKPKPKRKSA